VRPAARAAPLVRAQTVEGRLAAVPRCSAEAANELETAQHLGLAAPGSGAGAELVAIVCSICCRLEMSQAAISGSRVTPPV
jgi:hypothetical protein